MKRGFSLVELLVVVLVISILAAIALPNFMNAQTRAKVAQSFSNMKAYDTAIQQFQFDKGVMLVDLDDGLTHFGLDRIESAFNGVGYYGQYNESRDSFSVFAPLTTPIAYLNQLIPDPLFYQRNPEEPVSEFYGYHNKDLHSDSYYNARGALRRHELRGEFIGSVRIFLQPGQYFLHGFGPGYQYSNVCYNITNGIMSDGVLVFISGEGVLQ